MYPIPEGEDSSLTTATAPIVTTMIAVLPALIFFGFSLKENTIRHPVA